MGGVAPEWGWQRGYFGLNGIRRRRLGGSLVRWIWGSGLGEPHSLVAAAGRSGQFFQEVMRSVNGTRMAQSVSALPLCKRCQVLARGAKSNCFHAISGCNSLHTRKVQAMRQRTSCLRLTSSSLSLCGKPNVNTPPEPLLPEAP